MYQPRISDENVRRLYQLKVERKKPMTHVLDEIINGYFETNNYRQQHHIFPLPVQHPEHQQIREFGDTDAERQKKSPGGLNLSRSPEMPIPMNKDIGTQAAGSTKTAIP
jgi:hypothetical protein